MNIPTKPLAKSFQTHTYAELRQQIHHDLRVQHPEWVKLNGKSHKCDEHEERLRELLEALARSESNEFPLLSAKIRGADRQMESAAGYKG